MQEIQHVPLKLGKEEIKRLQQADPKYSELIENMILYKTVQDHGKAFKALIYNA